MPTKILTKTDFSDGSICFLPLPLRWHEALQIHMTTFEALIPKVIANKKDSVQAKVSITLGIKLLIILSPRCLPVLSFQNMAETNYVGGHR